MKKLCSVFSVSSLFLLLVSVSLITPHDAFAAKKGRYKIEIYSLKMGMVGYVLSFALSDLINKHSKMLEATCVETSGSPENIFTLEKRPEIRKHWVGVVTVNTRHQASYGISPFPKPFRDIRALGMIAQACSVFGTLDPKIKTLNDMVGKRVMINTSVSNSGLIMELILRKGAGLYDKMKIVRGGMAEAQRALIDGTIDVGWVSVIPTKKRSDGTWNWVPAPASGELFQTAKTYVIPIPANIIDKAAKSTGFPIVPIKCAGGTFGKSTFPTWTGNEFRLGWYVDKDMPNKIVTEIMRILWEYAGDFRNYHAAGKAITHENLPALAEHRKLFHPAAIKWYEEHGVKKIGMD